MTTNTFLDEAIERGFVFQCTDIDALRAAMQAGPITAYIGFDCTADSLHVGSLVQIMILRLLQKHGHKPLVLLGGGTTRIGDPSSKRSTDS
jgi:tyrosyl-tRNA synthetase